MYLVKWQHLRIDRSLATWYLGGSLLLLGGCAGGRLGPILPTGMMPAETAAGQTWADASRARENRLVRFRFQFRDDLGAAGGRGSIRLTPGDSLRFDVIGALGVGRGSAFVVGDSAVWVEPEDDIRKMVPNYPLLWAMLGMVRPPAGDASVRRFRDERVEAWQFAVGVDTVEYVRSGAPAGKLIAEVRQAGRRIGRVETVFGADGVPVSSRLVVPSVPARLDITIVSSVAGTIFEPDTWDRPPPAP